MAFRTKLGQLIGMDALRVSAGDYQGIGNVHKFGYNADVGVSEETIWAEGGLYVHPTSASTMTVSSSSADDATGGTGAITVTWYGLDANYNRIDETVTLTGQTEVATTKSFLRVNRGIVRSAGSGGINAGAIYIGTGTVTAGVPANIFGSIVAGDGQTLMAIYTVPANETHYMASILMSTQGNANAVATARIVARPEGEVFQTKDKFILTRDGGPLWFTTEAPPSFPEKTDIEVRALASGAMDLSAVFELLTVENN